jgi:hypothetical protein
VYLNISKLKRKKLYNKIDGLVKSPKTVMPDPGSSPGQALIRHPEVIGFTGFSDKSESSTGCSLFPPRGREPE